ncbi:MAG: RsiV family protein [Dorea sp.]
MRKDDRNIKDILQNDAIKMDDEMIEKVDLLLENLPERQIKEDRVTPHVKRWQLAAAMLAVLVVLPNLNPAVANAMYEIPVLGEFFEVITVRDYQYEDATHEAKIKQPEITTDSENAEGAAIINGESEELINQIIADFEADLEEDGYRAVCVDYEVQCDTEEWFTLKILVSETAASGNEYYEYYHIDKKKGAAVKLSDLFADERYIEAISDSVHTQMIEQLESSEDGMISYWIKDEDTEEYYRIEKDQKFYFNSQGEIVIVYDEYVVAPGFMGCPEFVIPKEVYEEYLK